MKNYNLHWIRTVIMLVACLSILSLPLSAQSSYGSIVGTVTDPSGRVVTGASVTLTNLGTSQPRAIVSDNIGNYQFSYLLPGDYKLDVEKTGFKQETRPLVTVAVANSTRVDFTMQVGETTQTVQVTAQGELLQTQDATVGQVVGGLAVQDMPLDGRNVMNLISESAGVVAHADTAGQETRAGSTNYQVGGGMIGQGRIILDGVSLNLGISNQEAFIPIQDTIQEFQVMENNLPPEYGGTMNGVVNLATKSGTNKFHGTAYDYLRNKVLNANSYFSNSAGLARPPFTQNQYGVNGGGPIIRDKVFFYGAWEVFTQRVGTTFTATVPTAAEKTGDFSNLRTASGALIPIYDPATTCGQVNYLTQIKNPSCVTGQPIRTQFPGNKIPSGRFDATAAIMQKYWPLPNITGVANTNANNFVTNFGDPDDRNWESARVDYDISSKQRFFATFDRYSNSVPPFDPYGLGITMQDPQTTLGGMLADTYTLNASTVIDGRIGYYHNIHLIIPSNLGMDLTTVGWPVAYNTELLSPQLPQMKITGFSNSDGSQDGELTNSAVTRQIGGTLYLAGSLTKIVKRHTIKFGGEYAWLPSVNGGTTVESFSFTTNFTALNPTSPGSTGSGFASYLLGLGSSGSVGNNQSSDYSQKNGAFYVGDTYQVSRSLTLNLGLRWQYIGYWSDSTNLETVFLPGATNPALTAKGLSYPGNVTLVASPQYPGRTNLNPHWDLFAPRFGAAYRLTPKTVVRLGFGISYAPGAALTNLTPNSSPIAAATTAWVPTQNSGSTPVATLNNPFPTGINQPAGRNPIYETTTLGQSLTIPIPQAATPYIMNSNIGVERQFSSTDMLEVSYVNTRSVHNYAGSTGPNINQLPDQYDSMGSALLTPKTNPFYGLVATGTLAQPTIPAGQLLLPYPQFTTVSNVGASEFEATYNALIAKYQKRLAQGASITVSYVFSKNTGNAETVANRETAPPGAVQDYTNLKNELSLISFDVPQRLVVAYVTNLPFGRDGRFLRNLPSVADKLISGWGADGETTVQSGFPQILTAQATSLSTNFGAGTPRPNVTAGCAEPRSGSAESKLNQWFNTGCFSAPSSFGFGNEPRVDPTIREDGVINYDAALFKNTPIIKEGYQLQFRAEFFNLFNRVQFGPPGGQFGTPSFGVVGTQLNNAREIQFALRFTF